MLRETIEKIIRIVSFVLIPTICYYIVKKTDRRNYSRRDIFWIILFTYLWSFLNIFIHELGHAFTAWSFNQSVSEISVGVGPKLLRFNLGEANTIFNIFPLSGITRHPASFGSNKVRLIVLAMGVLTQFTFLLLVYWLLKKNKKWRETIIGHFCYYYAIKTAFWLTFVLNFPFVLARSDWTKITKILLGWK